MEWAQTSPTLPNSLELGVLRDHRDNIGRLSYLSDVFIENAHSTLNSTGRVRPANQIMRSRRYEATSASGIRSCSIESRSRTVTAWSSSESKSNVMQ